MIAMRRFRTSVVSASRSVCGVLSVALVLGAGFGAARAQDASPLSAIDWLRMGATPTQPGAYPLTPPSGAVGEEGISVRALDALRPEAIGLYPAARVGLPATLWGPTPAGDLAGLIATLPIDMLPALRDLSLRLLLSEFNAPLPDPGIAGGQPSGFLVARIDKLIEFGALDQAAAILDALGSVDPGLRLRRFDIGMLLGDEYRACNGILRSHPPVNDPSSTVFCLARAGQWDAADSTLTQAIADRALTPYEADLLTHFLEGDERLPGASTLLPPPIGTPTPLVWRLLEAAGDPVTTLGLPVAFAHADLRGTIGWRAQLEAAERLVRVGALSPNRLLGLYTERRAAASGGIWERVRLIQQLDDAITQNDPDAATRALAPAWEQIRAGELEVPMASLFATSLGAMRLTGTAGELAFRIGLLSDSYETVALGLDPNAASPEDRFLAAIARGLDPLRSGSMQGGVAQAVAQAFGPLSLMPPASQERLDHGQLGEEMLRILNRLGGPADPRVLAEGLTVLRHLGLEDIARRTALESLLLDRRG